MKEGKERRRGEMGRRERGQERRDVKGGKERRKREMGRREIDVYLDVYMDGEGNRER